MAPAPVTVVCIPRERFSRARDSFRNLTRTIPGDVPILYLDGPSPPAFRSWLQAEAAARPGMRILRKEFPFSTHEAYNMALPHVSTPYAVCCDNDIEFHPGWLEILLDCAESTGAWAAAPVFLERNAAGTRIHMAGGSCGAVRGPDGRPAYREIHHLAYQHTEALEGLPEFFPTELLEYHCFLVRMEIFRTIGKFDPAQWILKDHPDFALTIKAHGGSIFMARDARVTFCLPPPVLEEDRVFFLTRWCENWLEQGADGFAAKWGIHPGVSEWFRIYRRMAWMNGCLPLGRVLGGRAALALGRLILRLFAPWERRHNRATYPLACHKDQRAADSDIQNPHPEFWTARPDVQRMRALAARQFSIPNPS